MLAELFKKLDKSEHVTDDTIARLEIPLMDIVKQYRPELALHREIVRTPSHFADLITLAFKPSDALDEDVVDEKLEGRAMAAYGVLLGLRGLPGRLEDGGVDAEDLVAWVREARRLCWERGCKDIGDEQIGQLLANAPTGEDGAWPCEPVRDLLEDLASDDIGNGFAVGKHNLRGVTSRGIAEGGAQERSLEERVRNDALRLAPKWPFTARWLRAIADGYKSGARRHDNVAEWNDQFES